MGILRHHPAFATLCQAFGVSTLEQMREFAKALGAQPEGQRGPMEDPVERDLLLARLGPAPETVAKPRHPVGGVAGTTRKWSDDDGE